MISPRVISMWLQLISDTKKALGNADDVGLIGSEYFSILKSHPCV
jgi:hypothetical protein